MSGRISPSLRRAPRRDSGAVGEGNGGMDLAMPILGPWLTLGFRNYVCNDRVTSSDHEDGGFGCLADFVVFSALVLDGMLQGGGAIMVFAGYNDPRKKLVHNSVAWSIAPRPVGSGYGISAGGTF